MYWEIGRNAIARKHFDLLVIGGYRIFVVAADLLVQLLARAGAAELYLYVLLGTQAGEQDQVSRKIYNFNWLAHVEHEDLISFTHRGGLQHQLRRLGDGHEISLHIRVSDRHGSTRRDLLLEDRHYTAIAAKHISEAHGDIFCIRLRQRRNEHFCDPLCRSHYAARMYGLVRGDHDEIFDSDFSGYRRNVPCPERYYFQSLQRHVFPLKARVCKQLHDTRRTACTGA